MIRLPNSAAAGAWLRVTALLIGSSPVAHMASGQEALDRIERQVAKVEAKVAAREQGKEDLSRPKLLALKGDLDSAAPELERYLKDHPDDERALILSARLGELRGRFQDRVFDYRHLVEQPDEYAPLQAALDHVLALHPANAEANYWKARLYGAERMRVRNGQVVTEVEPDSALRYARRAVELAPENGAYRETVAYLVFRRDGPDSALAALRDLRGERDPMYQVLAPLAAVPVPSGSVFAWDFTVTYQQSFETPVMAGRDYPTLRIASFVIPKSLAEIGAFYRDRWPGFQFFPLDTSGRVFVQSLRSSGGTLTPAASRSDIPNPATRGLSLQLMVFRACRRPRCLLLNDRAVASALSMSADTVVSLLIILNFEPRDGH